MSFICIFVIKIMIYNSDKHNITLAAEAIKNGDVVAFPTETVYGLGADCTNPIAVSKIFEVKNRPSFNPLIVHVSKFSQLEEVSFAENENVKKLINKFWPGPLTLVLPKKNIIPDIVTSGHPTVAVRMPNHPVALKLIDAAGVPIAAPSANSFGFLSPTSAEHVAKQLGNKISIILDGGQSDVGVESTIIELINNRVTILRPGGLPIEEIRKIIPSVDVEQKDTLAPKAPGMLLQHYAPKIELKFLDEVNFNDLDINKVGYLSFNGNKVEQKFKVTRVLTKTNNLREAAANLFKYLHELENENIQLIIADRIAETGLGIAIMDRLTKAANRYR